jgi:hypothetical protein
LFNSQMGSLHVGACLKCMISGAAGELGCYWLLNLGASHESNKPLTNENFKQHIDVVIIIFYC